MAKRMGLLSLLLLFAACSGKADSGASSGPTLSPSPGLTVSAAALCTEMVDHLDRATSLVLAFANDTQSFSDEGGRDKIEKVLDDMRHDRSVAPSSFHVALDLQIRFLEEIVQYLTVGGEKEWDFRDFKSAGNEMAVQCRDAIQ